ncbi:MAG TPA: VIT domain-containing protein [Nannocystaceae bacterium]|nr:VIT domain-containing protein [Nannocystaceae bacterium]
MRKTHRTPPAALLVPATVVVLASGAAFVACNQVPIENIAGQAGAAAAVVDAATGPSAAEVTAISGPGGLRSKDLADGTFLGKGAKLSAGQEIWTPKGTLAELTLGQGARLRLNEDTAITVPDPGADITLARGEVVALVETSVGTPLQLRAGDDLVRIETGEVQLVHAGATRNIAVVHGRAIVESNGKRVELGAGERLTTPVANPERESKPELSLQPLAETGWSRAFEQADAMVDAVPRGVGSLTARVPGSQNEKQQALRLTDQRVTVNITGRLAHTEIEQAFFNDRGAVLEGIYRFPLPGDGSISGLQLLVGNRWMEGEIVEKQRGRQIFQQIVDATIPRDPALLEWERGNVFKLRIFPIPGRGERRVRLSYTQVLPTVGDAVRYRFPLGGSGATGTPIDRFSFTVNVDRTQVDLAKIAEVETPMLALDRSETSDTIQFHTDQVGFTPTYDIGLDIPIAKDDRTVHTDTHLDKDGQAYFMLALQPKLEFAKDSRPIHYAFVVDRSHSTTPELWTVARGMVEAMAGGMEEHDKFTVLACDTACDELPSGLQAASAPAVEATQRFLDDQDLAGASDIGNMIIEANDALLRAGGEDSRKVVVYLGDGSPSSGELAPDKLAKLVQEGAPDVRVEAIALGSRSDLVALSSMIQATGGDVMQVDARDDFDEIVRELRLRAEVPVAKNVRIDTPDGMVDVRHSETSGLRPGDGVVVTGKLAHPVKGDVRVTADGPDGPIEARFAVDVSASKTGTPAQNRHLPRTWAQMEIAHLTRTAGFDQQARIIALSKDYTVLSRFTSLIVLENDAMFREFNVVRSAKTTDKWTGVVEHATEAAKAEPTAPTGTADVTAGTTTAPPAPVTPSSKPEPAPDAEKEIARREAPKDLPDPFPGSARKQEEQRNRDFDFSEGGEAKPTEAPTDPSSFDDGFLGNTRTKGKGDVAGGSDGDDFADAPAIAAEDDEAPATGARGGAFAEPPPPKATKKTPSASQPAKPSSIASEDLRRGSGGWGGGPGRFRPPQPKLRIAAAPPASGKNLALVESLRRTVQADPSRRTAHGALVRAAIRVGHADALAFAKAWADVDPEHAPALTALADVLAAQGDPIATRAYASALEVTPFSRSQHDALARAFASKGDLRRACSHRRAIVSIDPQDASHHADLATCLHKAGRTPEARLVIADAHGRARTELASLARAEAELAGVTTAPAALKGQLRATLTWTGEDDLDVAIVDKAGRRISAMHPAKLTVREGAGLELVALGKVKGSVFVEVTRVGVRGGERLPPLRANLELRTPNGNKSFPIIVDEGSTRVAKVFWSL